MYLEKARGISILNGAGQARTCEAWNIVENTGLFLYNPSMYKKRLKDLKAIFKSYPKIKLVYVFGSRARGEEGPLSDFDFAVYLDEKDKKKNLGAKFSLMDKLSALLKTDRIDIVLLNLADSPELKYDIIANGRLIYEKEPFRVLVEPKILNEYFDFRYLLKKYQLTKA
ncbi:MAG: nucleotidyltransferase domain-containing protein [Deltaproteobacteria bacterium]